MRLFLSTYFFTFLTICVSLNHINRYTLSILSLFFIFFFDFTVTEKQLIELVPCIKILHDRAQQLGVIEDTAFLLRL